MTTSMNQSMSEMAERFKEESCLQLPSCSCDMGTDCWCLLPYVCDVLTDPELLIHDDTSLEKLLDFLKRLINQNATIYPCLLAFLHNVSTSSAINPIVFSFSLKLTGLLADKEHWFTFLEEKGILTHMLLPDSWCILEFWKNSSVRFGWLQGLSNMLQNGKAMEFLCKNGVVTAVLQLQYDKSFFIASLTTQILAPILNFTVTHEVYKSVGTPSGCLLTNDDLPLVTAQVVNHVFSSLDSNEQAKMLPALRLLAIILTQCKDPVISMLWKLVVVPLKALANMNSDSLTQSIMAVVQAALRSPEFKAPVSDVEALVEIMLYSKNANESVHCARKILQLQNCSELLKRKAADFILLPLLCATTTTTTLEPYEPDKYDNYYKTHLEKPLSRKFSCISLLHQCLSGLLDLLYKKSLGHIPIPKVQHFVMTFLRIGTGHQLLPSQEVRINPRFISCCKVQRSSLDVLGHLTVYDESRVFVQESLTILLQYLQSPDLSSTVLEKAYHATLKWLSICSPSPDWIIIKHDLFPLLKRHACDVRWEVRDSTFEFVTQLTAQFKANKDYTEILHSSDMIAVLFNSLSDGESYVQASAIIALGEVIVTCNSLREKAVTHLLKILAQNPECFSRRAAVKVFITLLKNPHSCAALEKDLSSVLVIAEKDFDWEVKVHTLELADVLIDKNCCTIQYVSGHSESPSTMQASDDMKTIGLFDFLMKCLFDCDRSVSQKACSLLIKLQTIMRKIPSGHSILNLETYTESWSSDIFPIYKKLQKAKSTWDIKKAHKVSYCPKECKYTLPKKMSLYRIFELLDLEQMQRTLLLGTENVTSSPRSLMEDILFVAKQERINVVDCY